jgi:hypothetical protein
MAAQVVVASPGTQGGAGGTRARFAGGRREMSWPTGSGTRGGTRASPVGEQDSDYGCKATRPYESPL